MAISRRVGTAHQWYLANHDGGRCPPYGWLFQVLQVFLCVLCASVV